MTRARAGWARGLARGAARGLALWVTAASLPAAGAAQLPEWVVGRPVVAVEVEGPGEALDVEVPGARVPAGTPLDARLLRRLTEAYVATERFADVQVEVVPVPGAGGEAGGVRLVVALAPRLVLLRLDFVGNVGLPAEALARAMDLGPGEELSPTMLDTRLDAARALYREAGFERARLDAFLRDTDDPSRKVVIVRVLEGPPTRIGRLRFEGGAPPGLAPADLLGLAPGERFDRRRVGDAARDAAAALRARGHLEADVEPPVAVRRRAHVVDLVFPVRVGPRYRVRLVGLGPVDRSVVLDALEVGEERLTSAASLDAMRARVLDAYARRGFVDAEVQVTRRRPAAGGEDVELVVEVAPGPQVEVAAVTFPGARHFPDDFLRREVVSYLEEDVPNSIVEPVDTEVVDALGFGGDPRERREVAAPLVVDPARVFYRPTYEEAVEHLAELYRAAGYLDARVGPARLERLAGGDAGVAVIPVAEGPQTRVGSVEVVGNSLAPAAVLLREAGLRAGQPFGYLAVEEARLRLADWYRERGHLFAAVTPIARFSSDATRADVRFEVTERFPVRVGRVIVEGAEATSESLVRELVRFGPGDLYVPARAREAQERLIGLGVFSSVTVGPDAPDLPERVKDVVVALTERPSQFLELRGGLSTGEGVRGGLEYGYRNLFGTATGLRLRVQLGYQFLIVDPQFRERVTALDLVDRLERRVSAGLELPWVPALDDVRLALDLVHLRDNQRDFGLDQNAVVLTGTWRPERRLTVTTTSQLENNDVQLFVSQTLEDFRLTVNDPRLRQLLRVPEGFSTLFALGTVVSLDLRDNAFDPSRGFYVALGGEWDRTLLAERIEVVPRSAQDPTTVQFFSNFLKLNVTANAYVPIGEEVVLAFQGRFGRIVHLSDRSETYPNRAFFLGGVNTMRGFLQDALIPQDRADLVESDRLRRICAKVPATADPLDDEACVDPDSLARSGDVFALLRVELRFPLVGTLRGGVFADIGNLWADATQLDLLNLRPTAGIGLRVQTPVGPLAFDYGFNILRRDLLEEDLGAFHFSIGLF